MAEGFANHYGADVLTAASAGLAPAQDTPPDTIMVMAEMNIDLSQHVPQRYDPFAVAEYDIVVNMAGYKLPGLPPKQLIEWLVRDPIGSPLATYRLVRDDLEQRVMRLILDLRKQARQ